LALGGWRAIADALACSGGGRLVWPDLEILQEKIEEIRESCEILRRFRGGRDGGR